jgi:LPXTG-motif cell wall-anchored protein
MKLHSLIPSRTALTVTCGIVFAAGVVSFRANADAWDKKTILTVNQTIQVKDTVLEPGQYVLKLVNSSSDRHIVQISNARENHVYGTILAIPKERMEPAGDTQFTFWETPAGKARALRAWFYPGDTIGQEFPYPKHLTDVAMVETKAEPAPAPPPAPVTEPAQPEQPAAQPEANREEEQKPVEVAQASPPPPAPQTPAPAPESAPAPAQELPKTGSLYPLAGIAGGILLGLYGLLRLKRLSQT